MSKIVSRLSSKAQTVIPREIRAYLKLKPGDRLRYRRTDAGVLIEKDDDLAEDPFATFWEWATPEDDEAYASL